MGMQAPQTVSTGGESEGGRQSNANTNHNMFCLKDKSNVCPRDDKS